MGNLWKPRGTLGKGIFSIWVTDKQTDIETCRTASSQIKFIFFDIIHIVKMEHREPHGCFLRSLAEKERPAEGVKDYSACNFLAENFVPASCNIEKETHLAVRNVITPQDVVLEIGGRYGTTSCEV